MHMHAVAAAHRWICAFIIYLVLLCVIIADPDLKKFTIVNKTADKPFWWAEEGVFMLSLCVCVYAFGCTKTE